ncbi:glycosyltransferase family 39 protein [Pseudotenacibaculum haliotis]|uniref:Glycosyltransferase family 39 protein n=1 Tax=Pseudotenacibaculum haliotis TaxID=1862138 RepID=A0ABW5LUP3_9FLAO
MKTNLLKILTKANFAVTSILLLCYGIIRYKVAFLRPEAKGDENSFLKMFNFFSENGYSEALAKGNSILFNLVASFVDFFASNPLFSLRITSLLFGILTIYMVLKIQKKFFSFDNKSYRNLAWITSVNVLIVSSILFLGINDTILYFLTALFFYYFLHLIQNTTAVKYYIYLGIIYGLMLITRKFGIIYLLPILVVLFLFFRNERLQWKQVIKNASILFLSSILIVAAANFNNLTQGKGLSFNEKELDDEINWIQLQYLTALKNSQGELAYGKHVSVEDVKQYIKENGEDSLPENSMVSSIFFDLGFTIKQSFRNVLTQTVPITRLTGILLMFIVLALLFNLRNKVKLKLPNKQYILIFSFVYILSLCFIVISYVEPRWYVSVLVLMPLPILKLLEKSIEKNKNKEVLSFLMINAALLAFIAMNAKYVITNFKEIIPF